MPLSRPRTLAARLLLLALSLATFSFASAPPEPGKYAGRFENAEEPDTTFSFYEKEGALWVETEFNVPVALEGGEQGVFTAPKSGARFAFAADGASMKLGEHAYSRIGPPVHHGFRPYSRQEYRIPMRDGVSLHAVVLRPADTAEPLPILIDRTPYGVDDNDQASLYRRRPELAASGYIFVEEDIRGKYGSGGQFVMNHPLADHADRRATDESTDAYDTVAWLVSNLPANNGRAGFVGTSYDGFLAIMGGIDPHPAVRAISPQAPMIDTWIGDDFFHNGALRQSYGYDYVYAMERSNQMGEVSYGDKDGYDYFLARGSFLQAVEQSGAGLLPTWKAFLEHPDYDGYWRSRGVEWHLSRPQVPTLSVGGYYDQEDMWGPQEEYRRLEAGDAGHENFLVLGPWRHGSWSLTQRHLGALDYGRPIGLEFRRDIELPFFEHYLKGRGEFGLEDTASFQTGSNRWMRYPGFPPPQARKAYLMLDAARRAGLSASAGVGPGQATGSVRWRSDPADPVPYRHRPIQPTYGPGSHWFTWLVEDQRFVSGRPDVASWTMPPLGAELTVTGEVVADLFCSTSGTDSDWVVKLIDQYPDDDPDEKMRGYQLMIAEEIFRGRYRQGFDTPRATPADTPEEYRFSLHAADHVFRRGHRLVVQVQSSWFPLYDRNPQKFVPSVMRARPGDYTPAVQAVWFDRQHPSHLELPVVGALPAGAESGAR